jgi:hypothetical protein
MGLRLSVAKLVYRFSFPDGRTESLDARAGATQDAVPHRTEHGVNPCRNSPLSNPDTKHSPQAVRQGPQVGGCEKVR